MHHLLLLRLHQETRNSHLFRSGNKIPQAVSPIEAPKALQKASKSNFSLLLCGIGRVWIKGAKNWSSWATPPTQQEANRTKKGREMKGAESRDQIEEAES